MSSREDLIATLASLDSASFEDVISSAYQQRLGTAGGAPVTRPDPQATARQFAEWLARRHMSSDLAIERVVYLPTRQGTMRFVCWKSIDYSILPIRTSSNRSTSPPTTSASRSSSPMSRRISGSGSSESRTRCSLQAGSWTAT